MKVNEKHRITTGPWGTNALAGCNGAFQFKKDGIVIRCIVSDGAGWEHVSVSLNVKRTPDWEEMCFVKEQFWDDHECVVQFHPPKSQYVNIHQYCLHLWRPKEFNIQTPPKIMV